MQRNVLETGIPGDGDLLWDVSSTLRTILHGIGYVHCGPHYSHAVLLELVV
jgi:hypothetical protein